MVVEVKPFVALLNAVCMAATVADETLPSVSARLPPLRCISPEVQPQIVAELHALPVVAEGVVNMAEAAAPRADVPMLRSPVRIICG